MVVRGAGPRRCPSAPPGGLPPRQGHWGPGRRLSREDERAGARHGVARPGSALPPAAPAGSVPEDPAVTAWGLGVTVWDPTVTGWGPVEAVWGVVVAVELQGDLVGPEGDSVGSCGGCVGHRSDHVGPQGDNRGSLG